MSSTRFIICPVSNAASYLEIVYDLYAEVKRFQPTHLVNGTQVLWTARSWEDRYTNVGSE